jgi:4-amino-4-deoxy-L-arabinose transferase-like glycosyltransferase
VAILAVLSVYVFGREVFSRRVGALMAGCVATSPFFFFLSRQAQTDMPFVGLMTVAMCFFMAGVFGKHRDDPTDKVSFGLSIGWILAVCVPQLTLILAGLARWRGGRSSAMGALTGSLNTVVAIGGALMILQAVPLLIGLWRGRDGTPETARVRLMFALAGFGISWLPMLGLLITALVTAPSGRDVLLNLNGWFVWGPTQALLYQTLLSIALYLTIGRAVVERRRMHLLMFYVFTALATLAKGLLGFMLPGAILFFYILLTREWRMLKRVELLRGILVFIAVSFPWYAAMLIRHNPAFYNRFFVHDHFKRLASGVHQIDEGSFEHFARWLGIGLFPWSALVPAALARFFTDERAREHSDRARAGLMLLLWALIAFTLFTLSSTKFHHYIFPAVPALAMLVALAIDDALDREMPRPWPLYLAAIGFGALIAWDIIDDPQTLKNLFTYKYDRKWDNAGWDLDFRAMLLATTAPALLGMLLMLLRNLKVRRAAVGLIFASSVALGIFCLDVYMPRVSQTWSQKGLWDHYYSVCERTEAPPGADTRKTYCAQPIVAFKLNWRGENYYSANEVIPIRDDDDFTHFLSQNEDVTFYGIMELARYRGEFQRKLPKELKSKNCIVYNENLKFVLAKAPCEKDDPERVAGK